MSLSFIENYEDFLQSLAKGEKVWTTERISKFLSATGNPQDSFSSIHISGTNGKGTLSHLLYNIYSRRYKTGLYTSPHLVDFRERIVTNDGCISEEWIADFLRAYRTEIEKYDLTYFETATAMAYHYFQQKNIDIAVIEVGLGGEKDATNVIRPVISIITYVDYDHVDILGPSLRDIAVQKAGIIKEGYFLTYEDKQEILDIFSERAKNNNCNMLVLKDFFRWTTSSITLEYMECMFESDFTGEKYTIKSKIIGEHQCKNIGLALLTTEVIRDEFRVDSREIVSAINSTSVPARFQVVGNNPTIVLDGAHNPSAVQALVSTIKRIEWRPKNILFSMMRDKDIESSLRILSEISESIIVTKVNNKRCAEIETLVDISSSYFKKVRGINNLETAYKTATAEGDVLVTGSFYLCGEVLKLLGFRLCRSSGAARI